MYFIILKCLYFSPDFFVWCGEPYHNLWILNGLRRSISSFRWFVSYSPSKNSSSVTTKINKLYLHIWKINRIIVSLNMSFMVWINTFVYLIFNLPSVFKSVSWLSTDHDFFPKPIFCEIIMVIWKDCIWLLLAEVEVTICRVVLGVDIKITWMCDLLKTHTWKLPEY